MLDYDAIIIGGGPSGLTAGLYLSRAKWRTLLLEKELFGGPLNDMENIENYPGFANGVAGAQLAAEMVAQATKYGLQIKQAEVKSIELFPDYRRVTCARGEKFTTSVIIVAGGSRPKKMGVPGEDDFQEKGVFHCAFCDGSRFTGKDIAVCGGGDAGITEALYMTKLASKVVLLEAKPALTATAILQERALTNPKMEIRCGVKVEAIIGSNQVEGILLTNHGNGQKECIPVSGVLVHVGLDPNTDYLKNIIPLNSHGEITVNENMATMVPYILAAGDIRSGSPRQVVTAVGDGAMAAITAIGLLRDGNLAAESK
jgi:thioredoxin reductase (NADPH)